MTYPLYTIAFRYIAIDILEALLSSSEPLSIADVTRKIIKDDPNKTLKNHHARVSALLTAWQSIGVCSSSKNGRKVFFFMEPTQREHAQAIIDFPKKYPVVKPND